MSHAAYSGRTLQAEGSGGVNLVMFGAPGSGKGTQCQFLWESRRLAHYSTGDMLRRHVAEGTSLGHVAQEIMSRGDLLPDGLMSDLVADAIAGPAGGFVLDGFPRTVAQTEALDAVLATTGLRLDAVINLKMPTYALVRRLVQRRVCARCGRVYNLALAPGLVVCDDDSAALVQRPDDQPEAIRHRLDVYLRETAPLLTFYGLRGQVIKIDGSSPVEQVRVRILRELDALEGSWSHPSHRIAEPGSNSLTQLTIPLAYTS